MNNRARFIRYISALIQFRNREGHPDVPALHIEILDGEEIRLGAWVGYVRQRYRAGKLPVERIEALSYVEGWQWGPLKPGPRSNDQRNNEILRDRSSGSSLQQIADKYGLSRQRIHQIVAADGRPVVVENREIVHADA
jgi:Mor family transcriptional regulator